MPIANLYTTGFQQRNREHFASIVRIALADRTITQEEKDFLKRTALKLQIEEANFEAILKNSTAYNMTFSYSEAERYERLFDLIRMILVDEIALESEKKIVKRLAIGLGFPIDRVEEMIPKALKIIESTSDAETFMKKLKH